MVTQQRWLYGINGALSRVPFDFQSRAPFDFQSSARQNGASKATTKVFLLFFYAVLLGWTLGFCVCFWLYGSSSVHFALLKTQVSMGKYFYTTERNDQAGDTRATVSTFDGRWQNM